MRDNGNQHYQRHPIDLILAGLHSEHGVGPGTRSTGPSELCLPAPPRPTLALTFFARATRFILDSSPSPTTTSHPRHMSSTTITTMATTARSPAHLRSLYRSLLRELPPRPILKAPRSPLHAHLRGTFAGRDASASSSSSTPQSSSSSVPAHPQHSQAHAEAEQLVAYLRSQRQYVALIERYNPGMDMDEEERVRLTARRVGMDLPVGYAADGGAGEK